MKKGLLPRWYNVYRVYAQNLSDGKKHCCNWVDYSNNLIKSPKAVVVQPQHKTGVESFVTRLFEKCLDRKPDEEGLKTWLGLLQSGTSRETVLRGFTNSIEFKGIISSFGL